MPIVLALIAAGSTVLLETHDEERANFLSAAETILARIPPNDSRLSYSLDDWLFHYEARDGLVYLCCSDAEAGRRLPFAFLAELQKKFLSTFDAALLSDPQPSDFGTFQSTLASLVHRYNTSPDSDPVRAAKAELQGVKDIMTQNVEQILSRGERLELLMDRTDQAANQSLAFRRRATGLRRQMWYKNVKVVALAGFCGLVLLLILASALSPN